MGVLKGREYGEEFWVKVGSHKEKGELVVRPFCKGVVFMKK